MTEVRRQRTKLPVGVPSGTIKVAFSFVIASQRRSNLKIES